MLKPSKPISRISSMPAVAESTLAKWHKESASIRSNLRRTQSLHTNKPQERLKTIARRVPFMAFPGVSSQLSSFARSYSRANLSRLGMSRAGSSANIAGYGSMANIAGRETDKFLTPSPITAGESFSDVSENGLFGMIFNEEDLEMMQPGWTLPLGFAVFTSVLASFQVGFNSGVLNVPQDIIVAALHLSTIQWSIAVAIFCIGGLFGSMIGGRFADRIGRKNFLIANNVAFIGGGLLEALASGFWMLSAGRLWIGIGCGGATVVVPMYLGEIAPANLRGSLGTMNQFAMVVGILVANILGQPLGGHTSWRYLLGLCLLPALIQTVMAATLLESPLWLVQQGGSKNRIHAEEILSKLRGTDEVDFDMECMIAETEGAKAEEEEDEEDGWMNRSASGSSNDIFGDAPPAASANGRGQYERGSLKKEASATKPAEPVVSLRHSIMNPEYRRPVLIGFGLQLAQQFSGINAVFFYSTMFFASAHMSDPWLGSVLASAVNVLATALSIYLIERSGRRPLLLISTSGMMLSCIGLTFALQYNLPSETGEMAPAWIGMISIVMVLIFVTFFEIGLGPIPWLIGSEIYPRQIRTQAMGISSTINWLSNFAVGLSFPTLAIWLDGYAFLPFAIVLFFAFILEYIYVPETQGKTLEEIQDEFQKEIEDEEERLVINQLEKAVPTTLSTAPTTTVPVGSTKFHRSASRDETPIPEGKEDEDGGGVHSNYVSSDNEGADGLNETGSGSGSGSDSNPTSGSLQASGSNSRRYSDAGVWEYHDDPAADEYEER